MWIFFACALQQAERTHHASVLLIIFPVIDDLMDPVQESCCHLLRWYVNYIITGWGRFCSYMSIVMAVDFFIHSWSQTSFFFDVNKGHKSLIPEISLFRLNGGKSTTTTQQDGDQLSPWQEQLPLLCCTLTRLIRTPWQLPFTSTITAKCSALATPNPDCDHTPSFTTFDSSLK